MDRNEIDPELIAGAERAGVPLEIYTMTGRELNETVKRGGPNAKLAKKFLEELFGESQEEFDASLTALDVPNLLTVDLERAYAGTGRQKGEIYNELKKRGYTLAIVENKSRMRRLDGSLVPNEYEGA